MTGEDFKKRRRINTNAYVFIALSLISFSTLLFSARSSVEDFKDMGLTMYSGLRGSIHGLSSFISRTVFSVRELATLKQAYDSLTDRISRYEQLERNAADIRQENTRLREQLGFSRTLSYRYIAVEIIGSDPDNLFSAFVINKGKNDGIENNMPVIAYQSGQAGREGLDGETGEVLVGKVVQTARFESLVMPLYDSTSYISSRLKDSRIEGIVEGQGSPEAPLLLRFVRRTREDIAIGEPVVTSGLGRVFPPGIKLGRVTRVLYQENDTSIEIELESSVDFSRLEYVFVIDPRSPAENGENPENGGGGN